MDDVPEWQKEFMCLPLWWPKASPTLRHAYLSDISIGAVMHWCKKVRPPTPTPWEFIRQHMTENTLAWQEFLRRGFVKAPAKVVFTTRYNRLSNKVEVDVDCPKQCSVDTDAASVLVFHDPTTPCLCGFLQNRFVSTVSKLEDGTKAGTEEIVVDKWNDWFPAVAVDWITTLYYAAQMDDKKDDSLNEVAGLLCML